MSPAVPGRILLIRVADAPVRKEPSRLSPFPSQTLVSLHARTSRRKKENRSAGLVPSKRTRSMETRSFFRLFVILGRIRLVKVWFWLSRRYECQPVTVLGR